MNGISPRAVIPVLHSNIIAPAMQHIILFITMTKFGRKSSVK